MSFTLAFRAADRASIQAASAEMAGHEEESTIRDAARQGKEMAARVKTLELCYWDNKILEDFALIVDPDVDLALQARRFPNANGLRLTRSALEDMTTLREDAATDTLLRDLMVLHLSIVRVDHMCLEGFSELRVLDPPDVAQDVYGRRGVFSHFLIFVGKIGAARLSVHGINAAVIRGLSAMQGDRNNWYIDPAFEVQHALDAIRKWMAIGRIRLQLGPEYTPCWPAHRLILADNQANHDLARRSPEICKAFYRRLRVRVDEIIDHITSDEAEATRFEQYKVKESLELMKDEKREQDIMEVVIAGKDTGCPVCGRA